MPSDAPSAPPSPEAVTPISVVVTTFRRRKLLPAVIEPLLRDDALAELIVVIDASHDGTLEDLQARARSDGRLKPIMNERNLGPHESRAVGVRAASSDVVLLLDDDVVPGEGLVRGHARQHELHPDHVVVGYMPTDLPERRRAGDFGRFVYDSWYQEQCDRYEADPESTLRDLWGGNVSLPRAGFLAAMEGSVFAARHQDRDLGLRLRREGLSGRFDRTLAADHRHDRPARAFVDEGVAVGRGMAMLHARWPAEVPGSRFDESSPQGRLKSWVSADAERLRRVTTALVALSHLLGLLRLWNAETRIGLLARHLGYRAGWRAGELAERHD